MNILEEILAFVNSFSFQLIIAELLICFPFRKRKTLPVGIFLLAAIAILFSRAMSPFMPWKEYGTFSRWPYFWIGDYFNAGLLVVFCLTFAAILLSFKVSPAVLLLACIASYIMQNLGYQVVEVFRYTAFGEEMTVAYRVTSIAVNLIIYLAISFLLRRVFCRADDLLPSRAFVAIFSAISILIIVGFSTFITLLDHTNSLLHVYAVICCSLLICEMVNACLRKKANIEKQKIEEIYQKAEWQYERSQNSIDLINRKCHDLRHELEALRAGVSIEEKAAYMGELERIIDTYDMAVHTGNRTLDTILTEKHEVCILKKIEFSYSTDGACIDFFQTIDLYTMLGNALDNAIEAEEREEGAMRYIYVGIKGERDMVVINIENFCSQPLVLEKGMPVTSKSNAENHGYGLKSIQQIAKKYAGQCTWILKDDRFVLNLLFPKGQT